MAGRSIAASVLAMLLLTASCGDNVEGSQRSVADPLSPQISATAEGEITFGDGSVTASIGVGQPAVASDIADPGVAACKSALQGAGGLERAAAIPLQLTVSEPQNASVNSMTMGFATYQIKSGTVSDIGLTSAWVVKYSRTPAQCKSAGDQASGKVDLSSSAGGTHSWATYLLLPQTSVQAASSVLVLPIVSFGSLPGTFDPAEPVGLQVVHCPSWDPALGPVTFVAVDPGAVMMEGCDAGGGQQGKDEICLQQYPDQSQERNGDLVIANRDLSLFDICSGAFGVSDDWTLTPEVQCALVAVAADHLSRGFTVADNMCTARDITDKLSDADWLGLATGVGCQFFAALAARGGGILAAGATAPAGPGAVAVGLATYGALKESLSFVCEGLLNGDLDPKKVGEHLESKHEANVAVDVLTKGKCIQNDEGGNPKWSAVNCP